MVKKFCNICFKYHEDGNCPEENPLEGHEICPGCKQYIDPIVCCCGEEIKDGHYHDNHNPVPMGCICHYDKDGCPEGPRGLPGIDGKD